MSDHHDERVASGYDRLAPTYVERIFDELKHKPLDRELLERLAASVRGLGPICDLGCGPGHVARYLREQGAEVEGIDLSPQMIEQARRLNPDIPSRQGNMRALPVEAEAWAAIVAFYSIIHIPRDEVVNVLRELRRTLRPGGWLLLAFHIGDETVHVEELWGHQVSLDFLFFRPEEMAAAVQSAGFALEAVLERDPYPDVEYPSRRAYILARKPMNDAVATERADR